MASEMRCLVLTLQRAQNMCTYCGLEVCRSTRQGLIKDSHAAWWESEDSESQFYGQLSTGPENQKQTNWGKTKTQANVFMHFFLGPFPF